MARGILKSVGKNASNDSKDVKLVQYYLNSYIKLAGGRKPLQQDGRIGRLTIKEIEYFQAQYVCMEKPDGRVDPNGKTFRYLTMYFDDCEQQQIEQNIARSTPNLSKQKTTLTKSKLRSNAGLAQYDVSYGNIPQDKRIVSNYAKNVIKMALKECGMNKAVMTSTLRTPTEQAKIMLRNAKINLKDQFRLYGANGDEVLKVYKENKTKKDEEVLALMVAKIEALAKKGARVSKHCVPVADYKKLNIIDIGLNSTKAVCKNFNKTKFTNALQNLAKEGYIEKFIDETNKSNTCWHIEIKPNKKAVIDVNKKSILIPFKLTDGNYGIC